MNEEKKSENLLFLFASVQPMDASDPLCIDICVRFEFYIFRLLDDNNNRLVFFLKGKREKKQHLENTSFMTGSHWVFTQPLLHLVGKTAFVEYEEWKRPTIWTDIVYMFIFARNFVNVYCAYSICLVSLWSVTS